MIPGLFDSRKTIIAMAHLGPLPGSPLYDTARGMEWLIADIIEDIEALQAGGVDAIMFGNEGDRPYLLKATPESLAAMAFIIGQVKAAGLGLTMTAARYCVLGEIMWTPGLNDQAIDRVHRQTQTRQVCAPICTFPHAVEERVLRANAKKAISSQKIHDLNLMNLFPADETN